MHSAILGMCVTYSHMTNPNVGAQESNVLEDGSVLSHGFQGGIAGIPRPWRYHHLNLGKMIRNQSGTEGISKKA